MSTIQPPESDNPYHAPQAFGFGESTAENGITTRTVSALQRARPWAMFVGVVSVLFGLLFMLFGSTATLLVVRGDLEGLGLANGPPEQAIGAALFYLISGLVLLITGALELRFATRAAAFVRSRSVEQLDNTLESLCTFWRSLGILAALVVTLMVVLFMVLLLFAPAMDVP